MKSILISLFFSFTAMFLWQYEIYSIHSGEGLFWLNRNLVSPYIISFLPSISFLLPFILKRKFSTGKIIVAEIILYIISVFCFEIGKNLSYAMYCRFCGWTNIHLVLFLFIGILTFVILGFGFWFTTCKLLQPIKKSNIVLISVTTLSVIPLSLLTSEIFPLFNQTDWVDTVKSGFPVFWITFLLGITGIRLARKL